MNDSYFSKNFNQRIEIGIGVHAGTVIAGNIRLGNEKKLLVMGYPVNVAARLQNATKELNNNFIISSEALKLTGKPLSGHPSSIVHLRGIEEPITVHYSESHMKMVFYKVFINLQFACRVRLAMQKVQIILIGARMATAQRTQLLTMFKNRYKWFSGLTLVEGVPTLAT